MPSELPSGRERHDAPTILLGQDGEPPTREWCTAQMRAEPNQSGPSGDAIDISTGEQRTVATGDYPVVLLYAFRYMLGRETYGVAQMADILIANRDVLAPYRDQIVWDINVALSEGRAGVEFDQSAWRRVRDALSVTRPIEAPAERDELSRPPDLGPA